MREEWVPLKKVNNVHFIGQYYQICGILCNTIRITILIWLGGLFFFPFRNQIFIYFTKKVSILVHVYTFLIPQNSKSMWNSLILLTSYNIYMIYKII